MSVDISNLSYDELEVLKGEVLQALSDRRCEGKDEWLASKAGQDFSVRARKLKEKYEKLASSVACKEAKLSVGLELSLNENSGGDDLFDGNDCYNITDLFEVEVSGTILNSKDFNQEFIGTLEGSMDEVLSNACSDAIGINPKVEKAVSAFLDELNDFNAELAESLDGIAVNSHDLLNNKKVVAKKSVKKVKK